MLELKRLVLLSSMVHATFKPTHCTTWHVLEKNVMISTRLSGWLVESPGVVSKTYVAIFLDTINMMRQTLHHCMSTWVTLTTFQGHSSVSFNWKCCILIWLSLNFLWLFITRSSVYQFLPPLSTSFFVCAWYKGDNCHVFWFDKNLNIDIQSGTPYFGSTD